MSQAFLSYAVRERKLARQIAHRLAYEGLGVWWDRSDRPGDRWGEAVTLALSRSDFVLALWSRKSVRSPIVLGEATAGFASGGLVSIVVDGVDPPPPFDACPTVDFEGWTGDADDYCWRRLRAVLMSAAPNGAPVRLDEAPLSPALYPIAGGPPIEPKEEGGPRPIAALAVFALVAAGVAGWTFRDKLPPPQKALEIARETFERYAPALSPDLPSERRGERARPEPL